MSWRGRSASSTRWVLFLHSGARHLAPLAGRAYGDRGFCRGVHGSPGQGSAPLSTTRLASVRTSQRAASKPRSLNCSRRAQQNEEEVASALSCFGQERVRPFVQQDGGDIEFVRSWSEIRPPPRSINFSNAVAFSFLQGFDHADSTLYLKMVGSCSGCSQSHATLQEGVKNL